MTNTVKIDSINLNNNNDTEQADDNVSSDVYNNEIIKYNEIFKTHGLGNTDRLIVVLYTANLARDVKHVSNELKRLLKGSYSENYVFQRIGKPHVKSAIQEVENIIYTRLNTTLLNENISHMNKFMTALLTNPESLSNPLIIEKVCKMYEKLIDKTIPTKTEQTINKTETVNKNMDMAGVWVKPVNGNVVPNETNTTEIKQNVS